MDNKRYWDGFELPDLQTEGLRLRYYDDESWALCVKQELNLVKWGVALAYRAREKKLSQSDREALIIRFENVVSQTSIVVKNVVDALKTLDENKRLECWQKRDEWKDRLENSVRRWISSDDERYIDEFWPIEKEHYDWFATYDVMLQLNRDAMDKESRQSGKAGDEITTTPETERNGKRTFFAIAVSLLVICVFLLSVWFLPLNAFNWLRNHPNSYGLQGSIIFLIGSIVVGLFKPQWRKWCWGTAGLAFLVLILSLLGGRNPNA